MSSQMMLSEAITDLLLFPFNGNAREAVCVIEAINRVKPTWRLLGFVDDNAELCGRDFYGYPVLGNKEIIADYPQAKLLVCPGRPENFRLRDQIIDGLSLTREHFAILIHPSAEIGTGSNIGYNTVLMAGVVLTAGVSIGNHCVILPNTVIAHESVVKDYCMMGSNVSVSGGVTIEEKSYIGTGSKIIQEVTIGRGSLIGIGTVVLKSTPANSKVAGNPGRLLEASCSLS